MKKFISLSTNLLTISFQVKSIENVAKDGAEEDIQEIDVTKEIVMSKGTVAELPEDNLSVKDLVIKSLIKEYVEPKIAEPSKTEE
jgi:hypothetical protein